MSIKLTKEPQERGAQCRSASFALCRSLHLLSDPALSSQGPTSLFWHQLLELKNPVWRTELGKAGRENRGIFRVHQFEKVEQFCITAGDPELSGEMRLDLRQ